MNKHVPHVYVLPEDDANRQLINGFRLYPSIDHRRIQVLSPSGGWRKVVDSFREEQVPEMDRNPNRFMVLLIDFDGDEGRFNFVREAVPDRLRNRVFIMGSWHEPEDLRQNLSMSYEDIGLAMARECNGDVEELWSHELLRHNTTELARSRRLTRHFLFR